MTATITTETALTRLKLGINDASNVYMTDVQYNTFLARAIVSQAAPYRFTLQDTGLWRLDGDDWGGNPYVLHISNPTTPFSAAATGGTYNLSCWGSLILTPSSSETDTTAYYDITGSVVDYAAIMAELYHWLYTHRTLQIASQTGTYVGETSRYLRQASDDWAGVSAGGQYYGGIR